MKNFEGYLKSKFGDSYVLLAGGGTKSLSDFLGYILYNSKNKKIQYKASNASNWSDLVSFGDRAFDSTNYLPLAGGTMTGSVVHKSSSLQRGVTPSKRTVMHRSWYDKDDKPLGWFEFASDTQGKNSIGLKVLTNTNASAANEFGGLIIYKKQNLTGSKDLEYNANTGELTSDKYVVRNGTSSQFLKADGSVDSNSYLTGITKKMVTDALGYIPSVNKELTNEDLDDIIIPGFYNAGGSNTVKNKPSGIDAFGLLVIHTASGNYYEQVLYQTGSNNSYRRFGNPDKWNSWIKDEHTNTWKPANTSLEGYAPKLTTGGGTIATQASEYVLTFKSGTDTAPVWRLLPANAYLNNTYTVNNGTLNLLASGTTKTTFTANQSGTSTFNIATGSKNGTISVGGTDVAVKGLGSRAYDSTSYLPLAGGTMVAGSMINWADWGQWGKDNATYPKAQGGLKWAGTSDWIQLSAEEVDSDDIRLILAFGDDTSPSLDIRNNSGTTTMRLLSSGEINAESFVKSGGTSSQFLKADGSVDSNSYITGITKTMVINALGYTPPTTDTNTTYSAGEGLSLSGTKFSLALTKALVTTALGYTPPTTNTWIAWKGATAKAAGTAGYMPAPTSAQREQFLRGDGSWVSLNNYSLPTATNKALGGVKTGAAITDTTGYTAVAIKDGIIYYKDTNTTYSDFVKSGSTAAHGLVPKPSTTAGTTHYLREDGTWAVPPNTTYSNMTGATADVAGTAGLVPAPAKGKQTSFLRGDGTWVIPTNTTYSDFVKSGKSAAHGLVPKPPTIAGTTKYLREDGSWVAPPNDNTWNANAVGVAGYVAAPTKAANANMTWQTNAEGVPAWRASNNHSHSYLPLSGGTLTGQVIHKNSDLQRGVRPSARTSLYRSWQDKNNRPLGHLEFVSETGGRNFVALWVLNNNTTSSTDTYGGLIIYKKDSESGNESMSFDANTGALTTKKYIVSGGTASQFLKADGSLDSKSYLLQNTSSGIADVNGNGENWWFKIATINITSGYVNRPIVFEISQRGYEFSILLIIFKSVNNKDPLLLSFTTNNVDVYYIKKTATSTWEVYGKYVEVWGTATLHRITGCGANIGVTVNMVNIGKSDPTGITQCTYSGNVASATKLNTGTTIYTAWGNTYWSNGVPNSINGTLGDVLCIEFTGVSSSDNHGGFLDFHYNNSSADYTSRIIEDANGRLAINSTIWANNSGNVGIGTTGSSYKLDVNGNVRASNFYTTSDRSKKQNISLFSEHIRKFQLKDTEKWHYGVIAQEVPEMFRDGEEGNMTVNYNSVLSFYIGLLENRVKELEQKIKLLETK